MTSSVIQALATVYGASVIQASTFNIPTGDYIIVPWSIAQRRINLIGRKLFVNVPGGDVEDPNVMWLQRDDVTGSNASIKTIIAITIKNQVSTRQALNTASMEKQTFDVTKVIEDVKAWHVVQDTLTNLSAYWDVLGSGAWLQEAVDPESLSFMAPANDYQRLYEALACIYKQNAGSTPTLEPFYAAVSGSKPF